MSHGMYVTCDNPACGKRVIEDEVSGWLHIQALKSQKDAAELEGQMQGELQNLMLSGANQFEAVNTIREKYGKVSKYDDDFCSEACVIAYLSFKINERQLEDEIASESPPADQELERFELREEVPTIENLRDLWPTIKGGFESDQSGDPTAAPEGQDDEDDDPPDMGVGAPI